MISQIHFESELEDLIKSHRTLLVIDAFATWCGPCRALAPKLEMMSIKYSNILIVKVDVDELTTFADRYNITAMPTLLFIKAGKTVAVVEGANASLIENTIQRHL